MTIEYVTEYLVVFVSLIVRHLTSLIKLLMLSCSLCKCLMFLYWQYLTNVCLLYAMIRPMMYN